MEVRIGVTHASRELTLETSQAPDDIAKIVADALSGKASVLSLTDDKGRTVHVPTDKLAYVEVTGDTGRRMGFASR